jgi:quinol monooxygenase YgiN
MSLGLRVLFALAVLPIAFTRLAVAQDAGAAYLVTYVEAVPSAGDQAAALLGSFAAAARKDEGNLRFEVLRRIGTPRQFAILEVWKDAKAREGHGASAPVKALADKLRPLLASPPDERQNVALAVGAPPAPDAGAIHVVTHVDCVGARKDDCAALLRQLAETSRREAGNLRFDAWQQGNRPNHFTLVETWKDAKSMETHIVAAPTRQFRDSLQPFAGALYDERLYQAVN